MLVTKRVLVICSYPQERPDLGMPWTAIRSHRVLPPMSGLGTDMFLRDWGGEGACNSYGRSNSMIGLTCLSADDLLHAQRSARCHFRFRGHCRFHGDQRVGPGLKIDKNLKSKPEFQGQFEGVKVIMTLNYKGRIACNSTVMTVVIVRS